MTADVTPDELRALVKELRQDSWMRSASLPCQAADAIDALLARLTAAEDHATRIGALISGIEISSLGTRLGPEHREDDGWWTEPQGFALALQRFHDKATDCPECNGEGVIWGAPHVKQESPVALGLLVWGPPRCSLCGGTGERPS